MKSSMANAVIEALRPTFRRIGFSNKIADDNSFPLPPAECSRYQMDLNHTLFSTINSFGEFAIKS